MNSFELGEADRVLTLFTPDRGLLKAVAKGARKPGSKMSGRSDILCVNDLLLSSGKTFEIITQAETVESFRGLRTDFSRLSFGLFYAELTACFGQGLENDSRVYFDMLIDSLRLLSEPELDPATLSLQFELWLLDFLGYKPELAFCIAGREPLRENSLSRFDLEYGGIICSDCSRRERRMLVAESRHESGQSIVQEQSRSIQITPLVWKTLVLAADAGLSSTASAVQTVQSGTSQAKYQALRLLLSYIETRAGKRFKALDLLPEFGKSRSSHSKVKKTGFQY